MMVFYISKFNHQISTPMFITQNSLQIRPQHQPLSLSSSSTSNSLPFFPLSLYKNPRKLHTFSYFYCIFFCNHGAWRAIIFSIFHAKAEIISHAFMLPSPLQKPPPKQPSPKPPSKWFRCNRNFSWRQKQTHSDVLQLHFSNGRRRWVIIKALQKAFPWPPLRCFQLCSEFWRWWSSQTLGWTTFKKLFF